MASLSPCTVNPSACRRCPLSPSTRCAQTATGRHLQHDRATGCGSADCSFLVDRDAAPLFQNDVPGMAVSVWLHRTTLKRRDGRLQHDLNGSSIVRRLFFHVIDDEYGM